VHPRRAFCLRSLLRPPLIASAVDLHKDGAWSAAEDFSPTEEQEGYGIIGRGRRMLPSDYADMHSTRTLRDVTNPKIRGAALWFAHSLMARRHEDAVDFNILRQLFQQFPSAPRRAAT
jgi:hypothetical protein